MGAEAREPEETGVGCLNINERPGPGMLRCPPTPDRASPAGVRAPQRHRDAVAVASCDWPRRRRRGSVPSPRPEAGR
jgi:hypothetical protein